jgi:hypothetical protein
METGGRYERKSAIRSLWLVTPASEFRFAVGLAVFFTDIWTVF